MTRLDEFTKDEWRDVARRLRPDWSAEKFEQEWLEFCEFKRKKKLQ